MLIRKVLPYALTQFLIVAFQWASMIYLPLYFKELGFSNARIGALISIFSLSTLFLVFPLGVLSDRLPPRPMIVIGSVLAVAFNILMPRFPGFGPSCLLILIGGAGFTLSSISLYSLFFKQVGAENRGIEVSAFNIGGIMGAGAAALLVGALIQAFSSTAIIFPLGAIFSLAWTALALFLPATRGLSFPILEYGRDLRKARTWVLIAIMFVTASHSGFEQAGYTLLQTEVIGLSVRQVGDLFMIISVWMAIITVVTGRLHDRQ